MRANGREVRPGPGPSPWGEVDRAIVQQPPGAVLRGRDRRLRFRSAGCMRPRPNL